MDFLLEFLFGLFVELPLEATMESKRIKTWIKTLVMFVFMNLLTVLFAVIAWNCSQDGETDLVTTSIAAGWFLISVVACVYGHLHNWNTKSDSLMPVVVEKHRNEPKPGLTIRTATMADLEAIARVEAACFPAAEAAAREEFRERLKYYPNHFWLMFDGERLISFVDGFVTNEQDLTDEMYSNAGLHNEAGKWQMIFGVNTLPECRCRGYAGQLIRRAISDAREQGRKGLVLTCKPEKVTYYLQFGFQNEGISQNSTHGGAVWHQMRLTF